MLNTFEKFKLRLWNPNPHDRKRMFYVTLDDITVSDSGLWYGDKEDQEEKWYQHEDGEWYPITYFFDESWVAMPFTGFVDDNGKDIYERDIVKVTDLAKNESYYGVVVYSPKYTAFIVKGKYVTAILGWHLHPYYKIEVVGNVFENRELIKELVINEEE